MYIDTSLDTPSALEVSFQADLVLFFFFAFWYRSHFSPSCFTALIYLQSDKYSSYLARLSEEILHWSLRRFLERNSVEIANVFHLKFLLLQVGLEFKSKPD